MLWIFPTALLASVSSFLFGYYWRNIRDRIDRLEAVIKSKADKKTEPQEPQSVVIDPLDEVQTALYEHEKMMRRLNPDE